MGPDGNLIGHRTVGYVATDDYAVDPFRLSDGSFLVAGLGRGLPLWKVDAEGNEIWERRVEGDPSTYPASGVAELDDGGFLVYGVKAVVPAPSYDGVLLRTDRNGQSIAPPPPPESATRSRPPAS